MCVDLYLHRCVQVQYCTYMSTHHEFANTSIKWCFRACNMQIIITPSKRNCAVEHIMILKTQCPCIFQKLLKSCSIQPTCDSSMIAAMKKLFFQIPNIPIGDAMCVCVSC